MTVENLRAGPLLFAARHHRTCNRFMDAVGLA